MATRIRASSKGQIVLPKDARDRLGITTGTELDVIETPTGIELRMVKRSTDLGVDEGLQRLRQIVRYDGPRLDERDWQQGIEGAVIEKWGRPAG